MMQPPKAPTEYAPAERSPDNIVREQTTHINRLSTLDTLLSAMPESVTILNDKRQIVYANEPFLQLPQVARQTAVLGKRVGEAFNCIHAQKSAGGCGTTKFCSTCGAVKATLKAQTGQKNVQECRINVDDGNESQALDLRVWATPFTHEGKAYTIFAAKDISNEKRRRVLEHIFFHDIINVAGAIQGLSHIMDMTSSIEELQEFGFKTMLRQASTQLIDEIMAQKQILAAENGELQAEPADVESRPLLENVLEVYANHPVAEERKLVLHAAADNVRLRTDKALLWRVIGNMVKNALEAAQPGETVTVGCQHLRGDVRFWVHNPTVMPRRVQLQVFQRSFSTKGSGRGLGTYSMKLLSENYLHGRVSFTSDAKMGTMFLAIYPLAWQETAVTPPEINSSAF